METNQVQKNKNVNYWWLSLITGVFSLVVAFLSLKEPLVTLQILTMFFIAFFIVSGISQIVFAIRNKKTLNNTSWILVDGVINLIFGLILIAVPVASVIVFVYYVAFYLFFQALIGIWGAIALKNAHHEGWGYYLIAAIVSLIIALVLILQPQITIMFIDMLFSLALIWYGVYKIFYAFQVRNKG